MASCDFGMSYCMKSKSLEPLFHVPGIVHRLLLLVLYDAAGVFPRAKSNIPHHFILTSNHYDFLAKIEQDVEYFKGGETSVDQGDSRLDAESFVFLSRISNHS